MEQKQKEKEKQKCLFCRIAEKKADARILYEDDQCVAFEDLAPQAPVHFLVIPRKHIPTSLELTDGDEALVGRLYRVAARGFRLVMNTNPEAGQSVYHIHLHVLGGRPMHWPPG